MWTRPGYTPEQPKPPAESGKRLATFPRGEGAELRVNLSEYQGKPFVALRVWERGQDGVLWPVRGKGCSVRIGEARKLADVLAAVASGGRDAAPSTTSGIEHNATEHAEAPPVVAKGRSVRPPWEAAKLSTAVRPRGDFDEFEDTEAVRP